jgi:hypothetical protein
MSLTGGVNDAAANLSCEETSRPRVRGRNLFYKNRASCSPMLRQVRSGWDERAGAAAPSFVRVIIAPLANHTTAQ